MNWVSRWGSVVFVAIMLCAPADAAACIGLPLPSVRGADSSSDIAGGVRDVVSSFLTGPSLGTAALDARLADQALEEARQKNCDSVLTITLTRKRSGGGGTLGRVVGDAAGAAAWHMPYGSTAASTAVRSAAIAGSAAVTSFAANTRAKDELQIEYRLLSTTRGTLREGKDNAKAKADGEDLVTPLIERMATAIAAALKGK